MKNNKKLIVIIVISIVLIIGISCIFVLRSNKDNSKNISDNNENRIPDSDDNEKINDSNENKISDSDDSNKTQYLCKNDDRDYLRCDSYIKMLLYHSDSGYFSSPVYDYNSSLTPHSTDIGYGKDEYEKLSGKIDDIHIANFEYLISQYNTLNKKVLFSNDISIEVRVRIALIKYLTDNIDKIKEIYIGQKIKGSEIIKEINEIFNEKISSLDDTKGAIPCSFAYEYNKNEDVITITEDNSGCGGPGNLLEGFDIKSEETSTGINIYVRFMYADLYSVGNDGFEYDIYSDLIKNTNNYIGRYTYLGEGEEDIYDKILKNKKYEDFKQYKFVFKLDNGNYLFESIEKIN